MIPRGIAYDLYSGDRFDRVVVLFNSVIDFRFCKSWFYLSLLSFFFFFL